MFGKNKVNSSSEFFSRYRNENTFLISRYKNILSYIQALGETNDYEKNEITGFLKAHFAYAETYGAAKRGKIDELFNTLKYNQKRLITLLSELIDLLEEENTSLTNYLSNLNPNSNNIHQELSNLLKSYAQKLVAKVTELRTIVPNIDKLEKLAIGYEDELLDESAENYNKLYTEFTELITKESSIEYIFEMLKRMIIYLNKYIGDLENLHRDTEEEFLDHLKTDKGTDAGKLASAFFNAGRGKPLYQDIVDLIEGDQNKTYNQLQDKEKVDKFISKALKELFKNIKTKAIKDKIEKIGKDDSKFKELKEQYNTLYTAVSNHVHDKGYVYTANESRLVMTIDNLIYHFTDEKGKDKELSFYQFTKDYLKDDKNRIEIIKTAISILGKLNTNEDTLNNYLENQVVRGLIKKPGESSSSSSSSDFNKLKDDKKEEIIKKFKTNTKIYQTFLEEAQSIANDDLYQSEIQNLLNATKFFLDPNNLSDERKIKAFILTVFKNQGGTSTEDNINDLYIQLKSLKDILNQEKDNSLNTDKLSEIFTKVHGIYNTLSNNL